MSNKGKEYKKFPEYGLHGGNHCQWWWRRKTHRQQARATAHLSSKLTERLSLRNNTQANYHHILRWSHQCKNKSQRQGNWQSHHVLLLDQTWFAGQHWTFCSPGSHQEPEGQPLCHSNFSDWFWVTELSEWVIVLLYCIISDLMSSYTAKTLK